MLRHLPGGLIRTQQARQRCPLPRSSHGGRGRRSNPSGHGRSSGAPQSAPLQNRPSYSWAQRRGRAGFRFQCGTRCPWRTKIQCAAVIFRSAGKTVPACAAPAARPGSALRGLPGLPWGKRCPAKDSSSPPPARCGRPSRCGADSPAPASGNPGCGR